MAEINIKKFIGRKGKIHNARWEQAFDRILTPFEEFIHRQTTSGVLLMICAVIALIIANSSYYPAYEHILKTYTGLSFGDGGFKMSVHHWVNDGLMAFFFFHVGLELKREFLVGRAVGSETSSSANYGGYRRYGCACPDLFRA